MAIIFSYPPIQSTDVTASDKLILSQMNSDGNPTRSITVGELSKFISSTPPGGPFLPLTAGSTVPLTGDLYMAPNGAGPSAGSRAIVFRGIDDTGTELSSAEIFTVDSSINPSGQDLYFNNADDAGVLQTNLMIDAFGSVGIGTTSPSTTLDVTGSGNFDTSLNVGGNFTCDLNAFIGSNLNLTAYQFGVPGIPVYNLAVDNTGGVITVPTSSGVPWPYQYDVGNGILIQGENPGTTGTDNTALGVAAGLSLGSARECTIVGRNAGRRITTGNVNTLFGYNAGQNLVTGSSNVAIGWQALDSEVAGQRSVAVGLNALRFQSHGVGINVDNVGVGYDAGGQITTGIRNSIVGSLAGNALTLGGRNTAIGYAALGTEDTGGYSTAVGSRALNDQQGSGAPEVYNTAIGADAGAIVTTGVENTIVGALAGDSLTTGSNNIIIGYDAEASAPGVDNEITIGSINHDTLRMPGLSTGSITGDVMTYNATTGYISLQTPSLSLPWLYEYDAANENFVQGEGPNITGTGNTGYGVGSLPLLDLGNNNTAFGANTGLNLENSSDNVMIGYNAGRNFRPGGTTCDRNTVVGSGITFALNPQGDDNTCVGYRAGSNIDSGSKNVFIGADAGRVNNLGTDNVAIGYKALEVQTGSARNVAMGSLALTAASGTAVNNTAIGYESGTAITNGDNNVLLGYQAGSTITTGSNNICIGYTSQPSSSTVSNEINIGGPTSRDVRFPGGLPAYDDDAAAGVGGLLANMLYQTTGAGAAPLNVAGIVMIKQ